MRWIDQTRSLSRTLYQEIDSPVCANYANRIQALLLLKQIVIQGDNKGWLSAHKETNYVTNYVTTQYGRDSVLVISVHQWSL